MELGAGAPIGSKASSLEWIPVRWRSGVQGGYVGEQLSILSQVLRGTRAFEFVKDCVAHRNILSISLFLAFLRTPKSHHQYRHYHYHYQGNVCLLQ